MAGQRLLQVGQYLWQLFELRVQIVEVFRLVANLYGNLLSGQRAGQFYDMIRQDLMEVRERSISADGKSYPRQGRFLRRSLRMFLAMMTFSLTWKSSIPTQAKSAPFSNAYLKPSLG